MHGALDADGQVVGVLADGLERMALQRDYRGYLMNRRLTLVSPYDPGVGFNVGNAMQRNKLIYALADAGLVVSSDYQKGGTWAGAVEQLQKLRFVPMYVHVNSISSQGIEELLKLGARRWPEPDNPSALVETIAAQTPLPQVMPEQGSLLFSFQERPVTEYGAKSASPLTAEPTATPQAETVTTSPADELFAKVKELLQDMETPKTEIEVAEELQISRTQAKDWLQRLVAEGVLEKLSKPVRYRSVFSRASLFERLGGS
jgi:predicted Rossmann fold nucleotide-binding protein DprA/Smf involved in DNA uptake